MITETKLKESDKDTMWLHFNYDWLLERYNGKYIVIKNQDVLGYDENLDKLKQDLRKRGEEPHHLLIEHVRDKRNFI